MLFVSFPLLFCSCWAVGMQVAVEVALATGKKPPNVQRVLRQAAETPAVPLWPDPVAEAEAAREARKTKAAAGSLHFGHLGTQQL